jgi:putative transcriptional regulator
MIKHHPSSALIEAFSQGELPASLSAAVAMHTELCPHCRQLVDDLTEQSAAASFEQPAALPLDDTLDFEQMLADITASEDSDLPQIHVPVTIEINEQKFELPRAISHMNRGRWLSLGKLSRSRLNLNEGSVHTNLLYIQPGGGVPEHTHNGFELTLLLAGHFSDEMGEYSPGDFIMLDKAHLHQPHTETGCLCYTVADASMHFTQGINKLLNPIGQLIY